MINLCNFLKINHNLPYAEDFYYRARGKKIKLNT